MRGEDDERTTDVSAVGPMFVAEEPTGRYASAVRLICVAGADLGRTFKIIATPVVIGRGGHADVALRGPEISRQHAKLTSLGAEFMVEDLGSQNGTFVNGTEIEGK